MARILVARMPEILERTSAPTLLRLLTYNKTIAWHCCFGLDNTIAGLDIHLETRPGQVLYKLLNRITTLYTMSKGGVPDAWDDDWEKLADVSALYICLRYLRMRH